MQNKRVVLIAGGSGLVGEQLVAFLKSQAFEVRILTRSKSDKNKGVFHWNPAKQELDKDALTNVTHIINLVGTGIADEKWSRERKQLIIDSRVNPTLFLRKHAQNIIGLKQYISASGINCYGYNNYDKVYVEQDDFGKDYLSQVVEKWEKAADSFSDICKVTQLRISVVLDKNGGALPKLVKPVKFYVATALGSGKQWMPWISSYDLIRMFHYTIVNELEGAYNAVAANPTNKELTKKLTKFFKKPMFLPNAPAFILKLVFGEMSSLLLQGVNVSNKKITDTGFVFKDDTEQKALDRIYK